MNYKKHISKCIELSFSINYHFKRIVDEKAIDLQYRWQVESISMDLEELVKRFDRFYRIYKALLKEDLKR